MMLSFIEYISEGRYGHTLWIDPKGKVYDLKDKPGNTHYKWVHDNFEKYFGSGKPDQTKDELWDTPMEMGWARVRNTFSSLDVEVDLRKLNRAQKKRIRDIYDSDSMGLERSLYFDAWEKDKKNRSKDRGFYDYESIVDFLSEADAKEKSTSSIAKKLSKIPSVMKKIRDTANLKLQDATMAIMTTPIFYDYIAGPEWQKQQQAMTIVRMLRGLIGEESVSEVYKDSGLGDWFHKQSSGGDPGWDRYNTEGEKVGKCGDSEEGDPYAACLSKQKADKLGKEGIASFVRRKRKAQKDSGDSEKGGETKRGQRPTYVSTGTASESVIAEGKPRDMGKYAERMKAKLKDAGFDLRKPIGRKEAWDVIGSVAVSRLASMGSIDIKGGEPRK